MSCPLWVLGDVSEEDIAKARASLPKGAQLVSVSDEGTVAYSPAPPPWDYPLYEHPNWLKAALRRRGR